MISVQVDPLLSMRNLWARDQLPSKALAVAFRVEELSSGVRKDNEAILK
jgi:hypothetical protein